MKVIIIGAGIGGLSVAIALQRLDIEVNVYEAAAAILPLGAGIGLAANAIKGLNKLGIGQAVIQKGHLLTALQMLDANGRIISSQDTRLFGDRYRYQNLVIHRAALHEVLLGQLKPGTLLLGKRCSKVSQEGNQSVQVYFEDGTMEEGDLLIGADGIASGIRQQIFPGSTPRYAGYTCWRAVVDDPGLDFDREVSSETWAKEGRVGMVSLPGNKIYWYACISAKEKDPGMRSMSPDDLADHFKGMHQPVEELLRATKPEQLIWNDLADIRPLTGWSSGRIVLLGDAAHATTPNMGQGACQAIEDAVVLAESLHQESDWRKAFKRYEQIRVNRAHRVVRTSRLLGNVAHWKSSFGIGVRNLLLRNLPACYLKKQMKWLFDVPF